MASATRQYSDDRAWRRHALALAAFVGAALVGCRASQHDGSAPGPREAPSIASAGPTERASATGDGAADEHNPGNPAASAAEGPAWDDHDVDAGSKRPRHAVHVVAVGDSLTDETVIGGGYVRFLRARCPKSSVDNYAKGGAMVNQIRRRFEEEVLPQAAGKYTHLIVFGGVNDLYSDLTAGRTVEKITGDLIAIYSEAHRAGMKVVAITVAPWGGFTKYFNASRSAATRRLNDWIRAERTSGGVDVVVDAATLLACDDPTRLCPSFELTHPDGLHFNRAAHERLGAALVEAAFPDCL